MRPFFREEECLLTGNAMDQQAGGHLAGVNLLSAHGNDQPLDEVFEFPDIARPAMLLQYQQRIIGEALDRDPVRAAVDLEKVLAQHGDVSDALTQGRQIDRHNVDAVVQVLAKTARAGHFFERFVGGAEQAEIDLPQSPAAQPLHLVVFEDAQQFGLQGQGERCDFVEKQRAVIGQFYLPGPGFGRTGKGAFLTAE